jgi:NTP pyrophosphatase (non-canonical NTP hydrolase)
MYSLKEYQDAALKTAEYPDKGKNLIYPALGLVGEAGEVAEKIKKLWRNHNTTAGSSLTFDERDEIVKELGDVLWYITALASELGVSLNYVAAENIIKLHDRVERDVIKSEGDNR